MPIIRKYTCVLTPESVQKIKMLMIMKMLIVMMMNKEPDCGNEFGICDEEMDIYNGQQMHLIITTSKFHLKMLGRN
jgi:hypothetical protein